MKRILLAILALTLSCGEPADDSTAPLVPEDSGSNTDIEDATPTPVEEDVTQPEEPAKDAGTTTPEDGAESEPETTDGASEEEGEEGAALLPPDFALGAPVMLVDTLLFPFPAEDDATVTIGFDLDNTVSDDKDTAACSHLDYTSPEGEPGIDNNLASLTPLFDFVGLGQAFVYLESSIESSGFFLLWELGGVDDLDNDDEITLRFQVGGGGAILGTDGDLVAHQTMCIQNDSPNLLADTARIEKGWIIAEFESLVFPFVMFDRLYSVEMQHARFHGKIHPDGYVTDGVMGGTWPLDNIIEIAAKGGQNQGGLFETVEAIMTGMGDMPTDAGPCTGLSAAFSLSAVPVFIFPEDVDCDTCGNGSCEAFESCETCLEDCCPDCGNGECNFYPVQTHEVVFQGSGFSPATTGTLVGDTVVFTNNTDETIHLLCDGAFEVTEIEAGGTFENVMFLSGEYPCRTFEYLGVFGDIFVGDNYSETCQSCPQDCPDGC